MSTVAPVTRARSLRIRAAARLHAAALDERLSRGEFPFTEEVLQARAVYLLTPAQQRGLAANIDRAVARAGRGAAWTAAVPVTSRAAERDRDALTQLSGRLARGEATDPRGVALARRLLTDPDSPLFGGGGPDALWLAAREALLALGPTTQQAPVVGVPATKARSALRR